MNFSSLNRVVLVFIVLASSSVAMADPIVNGGFETGDYTGWTTNFTPPNNAALVIHWSIFGGNEGRVHDGNYSVDFNIYHVPATAVLSQSFATINGTQHDVKFYFGGLCIAGSDRSASMLFEVIGSDGNTVLGSKSLSQVGNGTTIWSEVSQSFTADGPTATLRFTDTTAQSYGCDALLDTVSVDAYITWKGGIDDTLTTWGVANNWTPISVPDGTGVRVCFGTQPAACSIVDMVSVGRTVGSIKFANNTNTTIQSTEGFSLALDNNGNVSTIDVAGNHTISAPLVLNNDALISGNGILNLSGGISGNHTLTVLSNLTASSIQVDTLAIGTTGVMAVPEPSSLILVCLGAISLLFYTRRKR